MAKDCIVEENGSKWMTIAQYVRALETHFQVQVSNTTVSKARREGKIPEDYQSKKLGKNCLNFTESVIPFLENSPNIAPDGLGELTRKWKASLSNESAKVVKDVVPTPEELDRVIPDKPAEEDEDLSVAREKARFEQIKRKKAEFEFEIFQGNYISTKDMEEVLSVLAVETRQAILSIIPRTKNILATLDQPLEIERLLKKEFTKALAKTETLDDILEENFIEKQQEKMENED